MEYIKMLSLSMLRTNYLTARDIYFTYLLNLETDFWFNIVRKTNFLEKSLNQKDCSLSSSLNVSELCNVLKRIKESVNKESINKVNITVNKLESLNKENVKKECVNKVNKECSLNEIDSNLVESSNLKGMDSSNLKGMDSSNLKGVDSSNLKGVDSRLKWVKGLDWANSKVNHFKAWIIYNDIKNYIEDSEVVKPCGGVLTKLKEDYKYEKLKSSSRAPWYEFLKKDSVLVY